jgi:hypothetical protein
MRDDQVRTVGVLGLVAAALVFATPALADIAPEPAARGGSSLGLALVAASVALEIVLLRFGFRTAWWKAAAAAITGSILSYLALSLLGFRDGNLDASTSTFLTYMFMTFAILVIVEAPVVFAFMRRQGWRWGFVALLVGNLISAVALTASM